MAVIKHKDTYSCDICGSLVDDCYHINLPVLTDLIETEYGESKLKEKEIENKDLDICEECLLKVIRVKRTIGFYRQDCYKIINKNEQELKLDNIDDFIKKLETNMPVPLVCGNYQSGYIAACEDIVSKIKDMLH